MKKFHFSLENVLKYKEQILDGLRTEHAIILAKIHRQEALLQETKHQYEACNQELKEKNCKGMTTLELSQYKQYLRTLQHKIKEQFNTLEQFKKEEEEKKEQLLEIKKEAASFVKLREKRFMEHRKLEQKEEELHIDEIISNKMYREKAE